MIIQLKELQEKFDTLENKNKDNIKSLEQANEALENNQEVIRCLKERIHHLEKDKEMLSKETQTETGIGLKCNECNFEAATNSELSWHLRGGKR